MKLLSLDIVYKDNLSIENDINGHTVYMEIER